MILDWRNTALSVHEFIRKKVESSGMKPHLSVILVGENPASRQYIRMKQKACEGAGMIFSLTELPEGVSEKELIAKIREMNENPNIHGILVQAPLPSHIIYRDIVEVIDPRKDVDGFTRTNIGNLFLWDTDWLVSCTPKGIKKLLDAYKIELTGKHVVIIGRSNIVGKPMSLIAINAWATVTTCNSKTQNLGEITKTADILIVAAGKPGLITREYVKPWAVVIDVGCTFVGWKACGDVYFDDVSPIASHISTVPGGIGPMTVAMVIENTWLAFQSQNTKDPSIRMNPLLFEYKNEGNL